MPKISTHRKTRYILLFSCFLIILIGYLIFTSINEPDQQCILKHSTTSQPILHPQTAQEYFLQGNYLYDSGNCSDAVASYTQAISLRPNFTQAYNNRAYTNMRLKKYAEALPDLDKAISINPKYVQALMNRGDIHNYYYQIDRKSAIADYERVIKLGATKNSSVCGHIFLAKHNGWNIGTILDIPLGIHKYCPN